MHFSERAPIVYLKVDVALTKVPSKYPDFADVFLPKLAIELSKHTKINDYAIDLVDNLQPPYSPINNLDPVELEMLKVYIKNNLANSFIKPSKSPIGAPILFNKKPDRSLRLCVNY